MKGKASRSLSVLLALCLALVLLPGTVRAADIAYPVVGGSIHFDPATGTVTRCDENALEAVIPARISGVPVTAIGARAFSGCGSLTDVTIPDSVTTIGEGAFTACSGLTDVTIPGGVTAIEAVTFSQCLGLTRVTIPDSVAGIGSGAFYECGSLTDIYYGDGESRWRQIAIDRDENGNAPLLTARVHYFTGGSNIPVVVNGAAVEWTDAGAFIDGSDRTMTPLRPVADAMGLKVGWDGDKRVAVFTDGSREIYFTIDSPVAGTNRGESVTMDTAAVIINERTYAPVRYLAEFFGHTVRWDGAARTVFIS